jgi:acetolactate synthase-1/2/3 large subunit
LDHDNEIAGVVADALDAAGRGEPVLVDVRIDYSKRTRFTQGVVQTVFKRFPLRDRARFVGRALLRKVTG